MLNSDQFQTFNGAKDETVIKIEKQINNTLEQLMKQRKINDKIYQKLRSTVHSHQGFMPWQRYIKVHLVAVTKT